MVFKLLFCSIIVLISFENCQSYNGNIKEEQKNLQILKKIDKKSTEDLLRKFIKASAPNRIPGSQGHRAAMEFIEQNLGQWTRPGESLIRQGSYKLNVGRAQENYRQDYIKKSSAFSNPNDPDVKAMKTWSEKLVEALAKFQNYKGQYLVWEKSSKQENVPLVILGAHVDTIGVDRDNYSVLLDGNFPGADKNASGVVVALQLVQAFSQMSLAFDLQIAFWDFHELGMESSNDFIETHHQKWKKREVIYLDLFMLGHDSKTMDKANRAGNFLVYIPQGTTPYASKSKWWQEQLEQSVKKLKNKIPSIRRIQFDPIIEDTDRSDVYNFTNAKIPNLLFTQNWITDGNEIRQHTSNDFAETLNFSSLSDATLYLAAALAFWP